MSKPENVPMNKSDDQAAASASQELPSELKALEARLAALSPRDDRLDRERLMYLAGRASVERPFETPDGMLHVWPQSKAWPAAFAGMTAVAVALLVALVVRPVTVPRLVQVAHDVDTTIGPPMVDHDSSINSEILSTSDARRRDIEQLLSVAGRAASSDAASPSIVEGDRDTLTPATWREVLESADLMHPRANDSSNIDLRVFQGVTS